ncbi:ANTAR domain-containing protein [Kribbella sp. NBC_01510]|uniref:ANTAR domain-containing protein n=1 Tax=Kribbella sp. NBC_01510 TaxID=2903581 RepID=UPI00386DA693
MPDVATEGRWSPQWSERVRAAGVRSAMHLPLIVAGGAEAVPSLYSEHADGFDADDIAVAHILARHAAVAIAAARSGSSMAQAVDARKLVGQAMGILMERYDLDSDRAFEVLKRYSQDNNRKLRDVAQELIDTRKLPARTEYSACTAGTWPPRTARSRGRSRPRFRVLRRQHQGPRNFSRGQSLNGFASVRLHEAACPSSIRATLDRVQPMQLPSFSATACWSAHCLLSSVMVRPVTVVW